MVREIRDNELTQLLELYLHLHEKEVPEDSENLRTMWQKIKDDKDHHIIVYEADGKIVSACVCVIIPNLSRGIRPHAFIENVVTHKDYRGRGYATKCLERAKEIAVETNCYKMMLFTGAKDEKTLNLYRNAGYNSNDKTGFIQWINCEP